MGLFEDLGRKVGEFTHEAKRAAADEARYVCNDCGSRFYTDRTCPDCGSEDVRELEPTRAADEGGEESAGSSEDATTGESAETDESASAADGTETDG